MAEYKHTALITDRFIKRFEGYARKALADERLITHVFVQAGLEDPMDCGDAKADALGHLSLFTFGPQRSQTGAIINAFNIAGLDKLDDLRGLDLGYTSVMEANDSPDTSDGPQQAIAGLVKNLKRLRGKRLINFMTPRGCRVQVTAHAQGLHDQYIF